MKLSKKTRKNLKQAIIKNRHLVKKYPWLKPWRRWHRGREQYGWDKRWRYHYTSWSGIPDGWSKAFGDIILEELNAEIKRSNLRYFRIVDMKEKWGRLQIDASGFNDEILHIIDKYEALSQNICAVCGKPDVFVTNDGWIYPLCYECYKRHWYMDKSASDEVVKEAYSKSIRKDADPTMASVVTKRINGKEIQIDISDTAEKIRRRYCRRKNND